MRRGTIKLAKPETELLQSVLNQMQYEGKPLLLQKIGVGLGAGTPEVRVDVSESDIEAVLDYLGMPLPKEAKLQSELRSKLSATLSQM